MLLMEFNQLKTQNYRRWWDNSTHLHQKSQLTMIQRKRALMCLSFVVVIEKSSIRMTLRASSRERRGSCHGTSEKQGGCLVIMTAGWTSYRDGLGQTPDGLLSGMGVKRLPLQSSPIFGICFVLKYCGCFSLTIH